MQLRKRPCRRNRDRARAIGRLISAMAQLRVIPLNIADGIVRARIRQAPSPTRNQKFEDSLLEGAVASELVSELKFPASWENAGNFLDSGVNGASRAAKKGAKSVSYGPIPDAPEQGMLCDRAGNSIGRPGNFSPRSGAPTGKARQCDLAIDICTSLGVNMTKFRLKDLPA